VELHDLGAFAAGLVLVGTLAYMAHLNDLRVAISTSFLACAIANRLRGVPVLSAKSAQS
jgi:hypothetical protein